MSDAYRLTFLLPQAMLLLVPEGRHMPCLHACVLIVDRGRVTIQGPSRERLFDQARRFFRAHARKLPALTVSAILDTPGDPALAIPRGRDGWTIVLNSDVTFTPAPIVDIRPALRVVEIEKRQAG